jgi:hypothetical protein
MIRKEIPLLSAPMMRLTHDFGPCRKMRKPAAHLKGKSRIGQGELPRAMRPLRGAPSGTLGPLPGGHHCQIQVV